MRTWQVRPGAIDAKRKNIMTERRFTASDGIGLFYRDYGPEDGTPVVICHGIAVNSTQFTEDADYLAARGYRVLTPDLRGHGNSAVAPPRGENYALQRLARDQVEMLDHAGIGKAHWVGNSLGGMVGLTLLAFHAERLTSLTTFGTPYDMRLPLPGAQPFVTINFTIWRWFAVNIAAALCTRDATARRRIVKMAMGADARVLGAIVSALASYDYIGAVAAAPIPVMLLHCHRDLLIGWAMGRTLREARRIERLRFVDLRSGGHCANLDATSQVRAALLEFWKTG